MPAGFVGIQSRLRMVTEAFLIPDGSREAQCLVHSNCFIIKNYKDGMEECPLFGAFSRSSVSPARPGIHTIRHRFLPAILNLIAGRLPNSSAFHLTPSAGPIKLDNGGWDKVKIGVFFGLSSKFCVAPTKPQKKLKKKVSPADYKRSAICFVSIMFDPAPCVV
jgi:hypothetical protein